MIVELHQDKGAYYCTVCTAEGKAVIKSPYWKAKAGGFLSMMVWLMRFYPDADLKPPRPKQPS